jgi:hypothetical protein
MEIPPFVEVSHEQIGPSICIKIDGLQPNAAKAIAKITQVR